MSPFRRRDEHSFWYNQEPISDPYEALSLLRSNNSSTIPPYLRRELIDALWTWEIVVPWYHEGSSGGDSSGEDYYEVVDAVAQRLKLESHVEPHVDKGWGWSRPNPDRLVISSRSKEMSIEHERVLRAAAAALLRPGIHTDLSGKPHQGGAGWDYDTNRFYVDFHTPSETTCRVYPERQEIIYPYPAAKQEAA